MGNGELGSPYYTMEEAAEKLGSSVLTLIRRFEAGLQAVHKRITIVSVERDGSIARFEIEGFNAGKMVEIREKIRREVPGWEGIGEETAVRIDEVLYRACDLQDLPNIEAYGGDGYVVLADSLPKLTALTEKQAEEKALDTRERTTLLVIIGALAEAAKIDLTQHHKAGEAVACMLQAKGVKLSGRAIGEHLKAVRMALESRIA